MILLIHALLLLFGLLAFFAGFLSVFDRSRVWHKFWLQHGEKYSYHPKVSVIVAARGVDENIKETIKSLRNQDYPSAYEVVFVADEDPALYKLLKKLCRPYKNFRVFISPKPETSSGKAVALSLGVSKAKHGVLAFCDSDETLPTNWLSSLVGPLIETSGAVTGYRMYVPSSFRSLVVAAWNIIGFALSVRHPYIIGGSYAVKKETMKKLGVLEKWKSTLSEDSVVNKQLERHSMGIKFAPSALVFSEYSSKFSHITEFTTRQLAIIRWYYPKLWKIALAMFLLNRIATVAGVILLYIYFINGSQLVLFESLLLLWPVVFGLLKASTDHRNLQKITGKKFGSRFAYVLADFAAQWLMTYNLIAAGLKKSLRWRGRTYVIERADKITVQ